MYIPKSWRWRAFSSPSFVAIVVGVLAGCSEATQPNTSETGDWAEAVAVGMQVQVASRAFRDDGPVTLPPTSKEATVPIIKFHESASNTALSAFSREKSSARLQRFRAPDGKVMTVGVVRESAEGPPKRLYFFKDAKIEMVVSPTYEREGNGWIRTKMRTTHFDQTGRVVLQSDWRGTRNGVRGVPRRPGPVPTERAVADATLALTQAAFSEDEGEDQNGNNCEQEKNAFKAKTAGAALASTLYIEAMFSCFWLGDPGACDRIVSLSAALLAASQSAVEAWEKYQKCLTGPPTPPPTIADGEGPEWEYEDDRSTLITVEDFIKNAEQAGTYYCTDGGNRCVYFAST